MKITKATIKNYKSLGTEQNCLLLNEGITTLIGKNESGKTNILNALLECQYNKKPNFTGKYNKNSSLAQVEIVLDLSFKNNENFNLDGLSSPFTTVVFTHDKPCKITGALSELINNDIEINEYKEIKERYDFMSEQRLDLEDSSNKLKSVINEMTETMKKQFAEQFKIINKNFGEVFAELFGGGKAELILADEENILECGIDIEVQPPGKKLQNMMLLSGGERAFTAIALLFAILKINPAPFCVLDEIEAALDDVNVYRFAEYLKKFSTESQFLVITHRKGTMEAADTVYGITMEEKGISKLLSMKLK